MNKIEWGSIAGLVLLILLLCYVLLRGPSVQTAPAPVAQPATTQWPNPTNAKG